MFLRRKSSSTSHQSLFLSTSPNVGFKLQAFSWQLLKTFSRINSHSIIIFNPIQSSFTTYTSSGNYESHLTPIYSPASCALLKRQEREYILFSFHQTKANQLMSDLGKSRCSGLSGNN